MSVLSIPALIILFLTLLLVVLWHRESRSMLNAGIFGVLIIYAYLLLLEFSFRAEHTSGLYTLLIALLIIGVPVVYLFGSVFLIWNGRTMAQREGMSLAHLLAPLVGIIPVFIVFAAVAIMFASYWSDGQLAGVGALLIAITVALYGYVLWNAWCTIPYAVFYTVMPKSSDPDFIIVHGAGLIGGRVTPLLASRLNRAINVFNSGGQRASIIVSGGQGADEPRSEAAAMADYLYEQGIPYDLVLLEDRSATTWENMVNSKSIIDSTGIANPDIVFVTSNYHVFRTALIARKAGLKAQGVGSKTARYYLPSAIIREYIAILVMYKWWHLILIGAFAMLLILLVFVS